MLLFPWRCDVPARHPPWAVLGLMAVMVLVQLAVFGSGGEGSRPVFDALSRGHGQVTPWRWLTALLVHDGWLHLGLSLAGLWTFGLMIEGRIGWWRLLLGGTAVAVLVGAIDQLTAAPTRPPGAGAGALIAALLGAVLWLMPRARLECLWIVGMKHGVCHLRWPWLALGWVAIGLLLAAVNGWPAREAISLLLGAGAGAVGAWVAVHWAWVPRDQRDLPSAIHAWHWGLPEVAADDAAVAAVFAAPASAPEPVEPPVLAPLAAVPESRPASAEATPATATSVLPLSELAETVRVRLALEDITAAYDEWLREPRLRELLSEDDAVSLAAGLIARHRRDLAETVLAWGRTSAAVTAALARAEMLAQRAAP